MGHNCDRAAFRPVSRRVTRMLQCPRLGKAWVTAECGPAGGACDDGRVTPTLVFDGDCGICTTLSDFTARRIRPAAGGFDIAAFQLVDLAPLGLTWEQCEAALQWVDGSGRAHAGPHAVVGMLRAGRAPWRVLGALGAALLRIPLVDRLAWRGYTWVADNRHRLPGGTPACSLPSARPPA